MPEKSFWTRLRDKLLRPQVDEEQLERCLHEVRQHLPIPVFWLLGKAQSGKTSVIRAITGSTRGEIGNGFHPCTRTAQIYSFPSDEECLLKFLDTRGLGEVDYNPAEDMRLFEDQSHLLIVVIKAMDHAQQCVLEPLQQILRIHPQWPLIVVQTCLHEAYPRDDYHLPSQHAAAGVAMCAGTELSGPRLGCHLLPYPFQTPPYPPPVPPDLVRSLATQRALFREYHARFVPVDFTLPEDGYNDEYYGLDALWSAIEEAVPLGLRGMLQDETRRRPFRDVYFDTAHPHVLSYAIAAGASAAVPVPLVDVPLVLSIQAKLFHTVASIYHQPMNRRLMAEIAGTLGLGYLVRLGGRELLKFIPGFGSVVAGLYAAASTYALGCTLCVYFSRIQDGDVPDPKLLRKLYAEQLEIGRQRLGPYLKRLVDKNRKEGAVSLPAALNQSTH